MDETSNEGFLDYEGLNRFYNGLKAKFLISTRVDEQLSLNAWNSQTLTQTITLQEEINSSDCVIVFPDANSLYDWVEYGISYIGNDENELLFTADTLPLTDIGIIVRVIGH